MAKSYLIISNSEDWIRGRVLSCVKDLGIAVGDWDALGALADTHILSKKRLGIEDVRQLIGELAKKPFNSEHVIAVIENADQLSLEAQNALLKIVEEPPLYATIMLCAENRDAILQTIQSRCFLIADVQNNPAYAVNQLQEELLPFLESSVAKRFVAIKGFGKDPQAAMAFMQKLTYYFRQLCYEQDSTPSTRQRFVKILRLLLRQEELLTKQISPQFALEILAIKLPKVGDRV